MKDRTFDNSRLSAKGASISQPAVPNSAQSGEKIREKKKDVQCIGKVVIRVARFLAAGKTCQAIF